MLICQGLTNLAMLMDYELDTANGFDGLVFIINVDNVKSNETCVISMSDLM